jgi:hypothetical protein
MTRLEAMLVWSKNAIIVLTLHFIKTTPRMEYSDSTSDNCEAEMKVQSSLSFLRLDWTFRPNFNYTSDRQAPAADRLTQTKLTNSVGGIQSGEPVIWQ